MNKHKVHLHEALLAAFLGSIVGLSPTPSRAEDQLKISPAVAEHFAKNPSEWKAFVKAVSEKDRTKALEEGSQAGLTRTQLDAIMTSSDKFADLVFEREDNVAYW